MKQHLVLLSLLALCALPLSAAVTTVRHYRLGEIDPGAVNGVAATNSLDSAGTNHLAVIVGAPVYSGDAASNNVIYTQRALNFFGTNALRAGVLTNLTDNFGLELWVKPRVGGGAHGLAYNGSTDSSGWGLYQIGNAYQVLYGGVIFFGSSPVVTNVWTHLALVRASGTTTFYVNGAAIATSVAAPQSPNGFFAVGSAPLAFSGEFFNGLLDEVRVFTFAPGAFDRKDLTYPSAFPRTLSYTREADNILHLSWPLAGLNFRLQSQGQVGAPFWADVPATYESNRFHAFEPMTQPAQFYRLVQDCDPALRVFVPIALFQVNNLSPRPLVEDPANSSFPQVQAYAFSFVNNKDLTFDFSQAFNPLSCSTNGLTFHYSILYENQTVPNPYRVAGITGYDTPVLRIKANSLVPTVEPEAMTIVVMITNELEPDPAKRELRCQITGEVASAVTLSQLNICQMGTNGCTNPNLLPVPP